VKETIDLPNQPQETCLDKRKLPLLFFLNSLGQYQISSALTSLKSMSASNILDDLAPALMVAITQQTAMESPTKKRKRNADSKSFTENGSKVIKSKKRKVAEDGDLDLALGISKAFSQMDNQLMADYVAQKTRKFESELSLIELEDRLISGSVPQVPA
jgi:hypothetical protein